MLVANPACKIVLHILTVDPRRYWRQYKLGNLNYPIPDFKHQGGGPVPCKDDDDWIVTLVQGLTPMLRNEEILYLHDEDGYGASTVVGGALLAVLYYIDSLEVVARLRLSHASRISKEGLIKGRDINHESRHHLIEQTHRVVREALVAQVKGANVIAGAVQADGTDPGPAAESKYAIVV